MFQVGQKIYAPSYFESKNNTNVLKFKGATKPQTKQKEQDDSGHIPDPVYNFFYELPKYELHSHFNGATPFNISKLFLNKEGMCIGLSEAELEQKYYDIRKKSESLGDWLKKTYELKAKNITTMDIMTASYAIAMEKAKHNCRYLEIRVDPHSSSFIGHPEDVVRAVQVGLRNAQEDIKTLGKEMNTGIIILAERHPNSPDEPFDAVIKRGLQRAKLATRMRSQRVLFDKMYKELKEAEKTGNVYDSSEILSNNYIEFKKLNKVLNNVDRLAHDVHLSRNYDEQRIIEKISSTKSLFENDIKLKKRHIPLSKIDQLYNEMTVSSPKAITTIDLVPAVYSTVMERAKNGEKNIVINIDPMDEIYKGSPEDILRAVQVGLRNAEIDLKDTNPVQTSIVIDPEPLSSDSAKAKELSRLTVKMRSQRVLFDNMYKEMKASVKEGKPFEYSKVVDDLENDLAALKEMDATLEEVISSKGYQTVKELKNAILMTVEAVRDNITNPTTKKKLEEALKDILDEAGNTALTNENRVKILDIYNNKMKEVNDYAEDKTFLAEKLLDNLKHYSNLKLSDLKTGSKLCDRFLRMGSGIIPNVVGMTRLTPDSITAIGDAINANAYIDNYNDRKMGLEKVKLFTKSSSKGIDIKESIVEGKCCNGKGLDHTDTAAVMKDDEFSSFDEADISPIYSRARISQDFDKLINILKANNSPEEYKKQITTRTLLEIGDKLKTQLKLQEQKFLLSRSMLADLNNYSKLRVNDKKTGSRDAVHYARMGLNIIPNVVGFDIAGKENDYPLYMHRKILQHIKYYNESRDHPDEELKVTVHAGEVKQSADVKGWENIQEAVRQGAHRIGHGIDLRNAPESLKDEIKLRNITLETCPKVNFQTRAVEGYRNHPVLDFLDEGLPANINTDNAVTAGTNLTNEFVKVFKRFNWNITPEERTQGIQERFTLGHVKQIIHNAIWGAFAMTAAEKQAEEQYAMQEIQKTVDKYKDKVVLKDDEPIMLKVQKQVIAFTGGLTKALAAQLNKDKAA
jgi:adenosine deaminase